MFPLVVVERRFAALPKLAKLVAATIIIFSCLVANGFKKDGYARHKLYCEAFAALNPITFAQGNHSIETYVEH